MFDKARTKGHVQLLMKRRMLTHSNYIERIFKFAGENFRNDNTCDKNLMIKNAMKAIYEIGDHCYYGAKYNFGRDLYKWIQRFNN